MPDTTVLKRGEVDLVEVEVGDVVVMVEEMEVGGRAILPVVAGVGVVIGEGKEAGAVEGGIETEAEMEEEKEVGMEAEIEAGMEAEIEAETGMEAETEVGIEMEAETRVETGMEAEIGAEIRMKEEIKTGEGTEVIPEMVIETGGDATVPIDLMTLEIKHHRKKKYNCKTIVGDILHKKLPNLLQLI